MDAVVDRAMGVPYAGRVLMARDLVSAEAETTQISGGAP